MGAGAPRPLACVAGFAAAAAAPTPAQPSPAQPSPAPPTPAFSIVGDTLPQSLTDTLGDAVRGRASVAGVIG